MGEHRIRSAWEIALERAERLGKLSAEDMRRRLEEELAPVGTALAQRYLAGLPFRDVETELEKRPAQERGVLAQAAMSALCDVISLEGGERVQRAIEGARLLCPEKSATEACDGIRHLMAEYGQSLGDAQTKLQPTIRRVLERRLGDVGISGSAVEVNVMASAEWRKAAHTLRDRYQGRLDGLKSTLLAACDRSRAQPA